MLVFNEGVPRAGKSYDAVKNHILPTLKKRRRVFARLNGLNHTLIAEYLGMTLDEVQSLLTLVDTKDVKTMFACVKHPDTGQWCIPDEFKDALVVIDEVHEFYVAERLPLTDAIENFWALLGQNGGDAVIMTQWINRVHQAVRARIERKNVFQKLTAVGLKNRYRVTYFHTTSPGKYERVGGKTEKYDSKIYPLYHGYAVGSENTEVYEEGATNVWRAMALRGVVFGGLGLVGVYVFVSFFMGGGAGLSKKADEEKNKAPPGMVAQVSKTHDPAVAIPSVPLKATAPDPLAGLSQEQQYVAALTERNRIRLAVSATYGDRQIGMVEWVDSSGNTVEQLTFDAIVALGYRIKVATYGIRLTAGDFAAVATPWPRERPRRDQDARLYRLDGAADGSGAVSVANGAGAGGGARGADAGSPSALVRVGDRPMGTFPESVQNRYGGN